MNKKMIALAGVVALAVIGAVVAYLLLSSKEYKVTFDSNGGSSVMMQTIKDGKTAIEPSAPTRNGYKFEGWYLDGKEFDFDTPITEDITLVAKWSLVSDDEEEIKEYKVTFDSDGGSSVTTQTIKDGKTAIEPSAPTRSGYKFEGWYLNGKKFDFDTPIIEDITLVARWEKTTASKPVTKPEEKPVTKPEEKPNTPSKVEVNKVTISASSLRLNIGESSTLSVTISPENATDKNVVWSSSNTSVVTVDSDGKVVAVSGGTATITATVDGKTATCEVTVVKPVTYSVEWVEIRESNIGQFTLYIKSSEGNYVSGKVEITTVNDKVSEVEVPITGAIYIKNAIKSVVIKSIN